MGGVFSSLQAQIHEATAPASPALPHDNASNDRKHEAGTSSRAKPLILPAAHIKSLPEEAFANSTSVPESEPCDKRGDCTWKTLISSPKTATDTLTVGIAICKPSSGFLAPHRHTQAEIYYITSGRGIMSVDGAESEVAAGSVVYIPGDAEHGIRNVDEREELRWLYCFAVDGFEEVVYRFTGENAAA